MPVPDAAQIGPQELRRALTSPDAVVRAQAVRRARLDAAMEPILIVVMDDPDPRVRHAAARALATMGLLRGSKALIRATRADPSGAVRREAVAGLGRLLAARWSETTPDTGAGP